LERGEVQAPKVGSEGCGTGEKLLEVGRGRFRFWWAAGGCCRAHETQVKEVREEAAYWGDVNDAMGREVEVEVGEACEGGEGGEGRQRGDISFCDDDLQLLETGEGGKGSAEMIKGCAVVYSCLMKLLETLHALEERGDIADGSKLLEATNGAKDYVGPGAAD
jgi:hypothetical protein